MKWQWTTTALAMVALLNTAGCAETQTLVARESCPAGMTTEVPAYNWHSGHLTREGWICRSIYSDG
jgi:hypothetical protein